MKLALNYFKHKGWSPFDFQTKAWKAYSSGNEGLIHVPTGAGKTYAAYLEALEGVVEDQGIQILYLSPLRALARDLVLALKDPIEVLNLPLRVESRTGDTSSATRVRQKKKPPHILVTTPESLSLLLTDPEAEKFWRNLKCVIVDEWHELLSSKRGVQIQLALSRLRRFSKPLVWGLSATIGNLNEAHASLLPAGIHGVLISSSIRKEIEIDSLISNEISSIPWGGHIGFYALSSLLGELKSEESTLIFTQTRFQAEKWFIELSRACPEQSLALHHGSLALEERERVEEGVKNGSIKWVVATSSLDLGVDFTPVSRIFQIGSPKSVARVIQRAGRSGHEPLKTSRITLIPTHALELLEIASVRKGCDLLQVESRSLLEKPYDVLCQHLATCALGGGFQKEELFDEVKRCYAYRNLSLEEFEKVLQLVYQGGSALKSYPEFNRLSEKDGVYQIQNKRFARLHRLNIGTIASDAQLHVMLGRTKRLGSVEEFFISKLERGDRFVFGGRVVEYLFSKETHVYVKLAKSKTQTIARWEGGRLPMAASLSKLLRKELEELKNHHGLESDTAEGKAFLPFLTIQKTLSQVPSQSELLIEVFESREGAHLFFYPFEGRLVHEGLAALLAYRMGKIQGGSFSLTANDYGVELLSHKGFPYSKVWTKELLSTQGLEADLERSLNLAELAKRRFRDIARVSGLTFQNYGGQRKTAGQLQTSAALLFDVFSRYDPENILLIQAKQEAMDASVEKNRLKETLVRLSEQTHLWSNLQKSSPFSFPLMMERLSGRLSTESVAERVLRMKTEWLKI